MTHNDLDFTATMDSTAVYDYIKALAAKQGNQYMDCMAEAFISIHGQSAPVPVGEIRQLAVKPGHMSDSEFKQMQCEVITTLADVKYLF